MMNTDAQVREPEDVEPSATLETPAGKPDTGDMAKWRTWLTKSTFWWMLRQPHLPVFSAALQGARVVDEQFLVPLTRESRHHSFVAPVDEPARNGAFAGLRLALETNAIGLSDRAFRVTLDVRKLLRWLDVNDRWWMMVGSQLEAFQATAKGRLPEAVVAALARESGSVLYSGAQTPATIAAGFAAFRVMLNENTLELACLEDGAVTEDVDGGGSGEDTGSEIVTEKIEIETEVIEVDSPQ